MIIHLIRHAHAGSRSDWSGDDSQRPLSKKGRAQSEVIADALLTELAAVADGHGGAVELWSSPFVRCVQTLEPLGDRLDLKVSSVEGLAEGGGGAAALDLLLAAAGAGTAVVACSHGDVIPAIIATALGRGATLDGDLEPRKAARYAMTVEDGRLTHLTHIPRPEV